MSRRAMRIEGVILYLWFIGLVAYFGLLVWALGYGWGFAAFIATLIWRLRRWK